MPPLLHLQSEAEYRAYFVENYVRAHVATYHGVRVHFSADQFDHAFYEATNRDGVKDQFSWVRAQRMKWIALTLNDPGAIWYQGWIKRLERYDPTRSVAVAYGDFVVILKFRATRSGVLKSNFVTCYDADNSIHKIRRSPAWDIRECRIALGIEGGR